MWAPVPVRPSPTVRIAVAAAQRAEERMTLVSPDRVVERAGGGRERSTDGCDGLHRAARGARRRQIESFVAPAEVKQWQ
jgi:hypothetical protein